MYTLSNNKKIRFSNETFQCTSCKGFIHNGYGVFLFAKLKHPIEKLCSVCSGQEENEDDKKK